MKNGIKILKNSFSIIGFGFLSFFLIHIFAIFGIFLSIGLIVLWLFMPKYTSCVLCRVTKDGEICKFCNTKINATTSKSPKTIRSVLFNSGILAIVSILSISVIFLETKALNFFGFPPTKKTVSFFLPTKGEVEVGEVFPVAITIGGIETPINAVRADVGFTTDTLEAVDVTTENSFATMFVQKEIDNGVGIIRIAGGLPNPGFPGPDGVLGMIYFRSKIPGVAKVDFLSSSVVLANDGRGTNVVKNLASTSYFIVPSTLKTHPGEASPAASVMELSDARTAGTQMHFYDQRGVLGTKTNGIDEDPIEIRETTISQVFLTSLQSFDSAVLSLWTNVIPDFFRPQD